MPIDVTNLLMLASNFMTPLVVLLGIAVLMKYLNRGESPNQSREIERLKSQFEESMAAIREDIKRSLFSDVQTSGKLTAAEHSALVMELHAKIKEDTADEVLSKIEQKIDESRDRGSRDIVVYNQCEQTIQRLRQELFALSKRGNLNLSIGIITTISGLFLLGSFVIDNALLPLSDKTAATLEQFLIDFLPRLSLVILIEVFAYFFLSLYKATLVEIKYFQNEITSIEAKFLALRLASLSDQSEQISTAVEALSKTERNFILNKDQTTVDLERARIDQVSRTDILGKIADLLKKKED